jgi:transposase
MAETQRWRAIPTPLELAEFEQFVLPHLSIGSPGPAPKLSLYKIVNYVLKMLYLGCQWKELPIHRDGEGHPVTHYTRIYRIWRHCVDNRGMDAILAPRCRDFMRTAVSILRSFMATARQRRRKRAVITSASAATTARSDPRPLPATGGISFRRGTARRDPACLHHAKKPPEVA